ncbi:hypothetical protein [Kiloniella antarctica]|uniref:NYN domain-containing protein n=1 Tax=Kiloniella antarctica TaxID=1550907 RepID=A0ABW5BKF7_9PROT
MKKIFIEQSLFHSIRSTKRHKRRKRKNAPVKKLRKDTFSQEKAIALLKVHGKPLRMPEVFCLDENCKETMRFIQNQRDLIFSDIKLLKKKATKKPHPLKQSWHYTDFTTAKKIGTSAALVLAADYDRFQILTKKKLYAIDFDQWEDTIKNTLDDLGFLKIFNIKNDNKIPITNKTKTLQFMSARNADDTVTPELIEGIKGFVDGLEDVSLLLLGDAISEAMTNVGHHAYPEDYKYTFQHINKWWTTASYNPEEKLLSVAFYDQGVSIPISLRNNHLSDIAKRLLQQLKGIAGFDNQSDAEMIDLAIQIGKTSTNRSERGKGLHDICSTLDQCAEGYIRILSRHGEYLYKKEQENSEGYGTLISHSNSIGGTLIEWGMKV